MNPPRLRTGRLTAWRLRRAAGRTGGPRIAILGAGAGGIAMGVRLKEAGLHDFTIFEKSPGVGGTWRDNTYPGAACDIMSHLYSFSFALNAAWSTTYAGQPEILAYLEAVTDRFALRPHLRCGTEVTEARWDDTAARWTLRTAAGETHEADILISALGMLNLPAYPGIDGLGDFTGDLFHSARWNPDVELAGRRVAVIGTGASAVQFVPHVAGRAARLDVYQRSPAWILPKQQRPYSEAEIRRFTRTPGAARLHRWGIFLQLERFTSFKVADERTRVRQGWATAHLERQVTDPALRAALTPGYPIGCKRLLPSNDYLPTFTRDDVELVTTGIERITPTGIRTVDGREREADVIILGTGFRATEYLAAVDVYGRDGRRLADEWKDGARAHLGTTVHGYPNLFTLYGPNTNQGGGSVLFVLESQTRYVAALIRRTFRRGRTAIEVRREVQERFNARIEAAMPGTVWLAGCGNYFRSRDGRISTQWPFPARRFWWETRWPKGVDHTTRAHPGRGRGPAASGTEPGAFRPGGTAPDGTERRETELHETQRHAHRELHENERHEPHQTGSDPDAGRAPAGQRTDGTARPV